MLGNFRQIITRAIQPRILLTTNRLNQTDADKSPVTANVPSGIWKLGKLNHIAVAVPSLDEASSFFKNVLHAKSVSGAVALKEHGVHTVFVDFGNTKIELLFPLGDKSPISRFLEKHKSGGIHHICIEVDNIEEAIKDIQQQNIRTLSETTQIGAHGKPVMFLHPKDCGGILIELEQAK
ncbi:unnamed protein product [Adineta steineri]|uniref:Methylmalonyl-CoA epimerase, mitochondrial n=2 Tax=Adineta steineri TaxID=433720 RepID=A0A818N6K5_9BILA|nr:unnamed protein product [Adineta steineri]CAF1138476.1 unnamed protein product [Adineta steineri]CAF1175428.1 unnamed protein product [Adineta steineri]CAF1291547.1 unnamed protein product [Adineta steineri]CAF3600577.1 unnamed protein product [Adineta steineri]